ncbi:transcriptional regulator of RNA polII, SAGA, subunit-domain-containing protein [Morchella snyderi]|nr:transcriptional regulator of RNA polII, SAGA, subunit-domain-containing protein [Morchella snyderi]
MVDMDAQTPTSRPTSSSASTKHPGKQSTSKAAPPPPPPPPPGPPVVPRIDLEPMYDALKRAMGKEAWAIYKEALSGYLTGRLNQEELSRAIGPFVKGNSIRMHNMLLVAMYGNSMRDMPPTDVAAWVSASDKPSAVAKMPAGDVNEKRLKKEVMAISARERRRIKEVPSALGDVEDMLGSMLQEYHLAKQVKIPEALPPMSAGLTKTNWDSEIKQRYTMPLSSESGEFPDVEIIRQRMNPICYEEGVHGGCTADAANFMNVAAETFVKEILSTIISRVRSNGPNYVQTDKYRKLAPKRKWTAPTERSLLGMHDMRLSLALGHNLLAQLPLSMKKIMAGGWYERDYEVDADEQYIGQVDVEGWEGAAVDDRKQLRGLLDDCLSVGV